MAHMKVSGWFAGLFQDSSRETELIANTGTQEISTQDSSRKSDKSEDNSGATLVEYALLALLISIVAIVSVRVFGERLSGYYSGIVQQVPE